MMPSDDEIEVKDQQTIEKDASHFSIGPYVNEDPTRFLELQIWGESLYDRVAELERELAEERKESLAALAKSMICQPHRIISGPYEDDPVPSWQWCRSHKQPLSICKYEIGDA